MAFMSLFLMIFWPLLLVAAALAVILPFLGMALNIVAWTLLGLNVLLFLLLLFIRKKWKATGQMDRAFIDTCTGWKYFALRSARILLTFGLVWEALASIFFAITSSGL